MGLSPELETPSVFASSSATHLASSTSKPLAATISLDDVVTKIT